MLIIAGIILNIMGIIGVVVPALPGIILNYAALILLYIARGEANFSSRILVFFGMLTVLVMLLDYILPLLGARKYGASRMGIWSAFFGMFIGIVFFPPFGIIFGLLIGAFVGEILAGKEKTQAFRTGFATLIGILSSMAVRFIISIIMTIYFFIHLF